MGGVWSPVLGSKEGGTDPTVTCEISKGFLEDETFPLGPHNELEWSQRETEGGERFEDGKSLSQTFATPCAKA